MQKFSFKRSISEFTKIDTCTITFESKLHFSLSKVIFSHGKQAGTRDISFLHDHQSEVSTSQTNQMLQIEGGAPEAPTTLIPEDYQIVRSERVAGLNIRPSHYSTHLAEGKRLSEVKGQLRH